MIATNSKGGGQWSLRRWRWLAAAAAAGSLFLVALGGATAGLIERQTIPISTTFVNPCNGDLLSFVGEQDVFFLGGNPDFGYHTNFHLTVTGSSGARYVVNGHNTSLTIYNKDPQSVGFENSGIAYITPGPGNDLVYRVISHVTWTPGGDQMVTSNIVAGECR